MRLGYDEVRGFANLPWGTKVFVDSSKQTVEFTIPGVEGRISIPFSELEQRNPNETLFDVAQTILKELHPELFKEKNV